MASPEPKPKMPLWRVGSLLTVSLPTDALRFIFASFLFFAPFIAAAAVQVYLETSGWPSWMAGLASLVAGATTAGAEVFFAPITAALMVFGFVMAFAVGVLGWLITTILLLIFGINPWGTRLMFTWFSGWILATPATLFIVRAVRNEDREKRKKWESEQKAEAAKRQQEVEVYVAEARATQEAELLATEVEQAEYEAANEETEQERRGAEGGI